MIIFKILIIFIIILCFFILKKFNFSKEQMTDNAKPDSLPYSIDQETMNQNENELSFNSDLSVLPVRFFGAKTTSGSLMICLERSC